MNSDKRSSKTLPESASIVIIGAGIVGCSVAWSLMQRGRADIVVLDQGALPETGGSTSHAPGLMFSTSSSRAMTHLAQRTIEIYSSLQHEDGPCYHTVGSLEISTSEARQRDLRRKLGWAQSWGNDDARLLSPDEVLRLVPIMDVSTIHGALHVPRDGLGKAVRVCDAMMREVRQCKAGEFFGHIEVRNIEVRNGRVQAVETSIGKIKADTVLICAGIWGPRVARMAGISIPLVPVQHQYTRTSPLKELKGETREIVQPIVRHQDADLYFRQHYDCYGAGSYDHEPQIVEPDDIRVLAPGMGAAQRPFTPSDFEAAWREAQRIFPALKTTAMRGAFNGMFSFTPDGMPVLGESKVRGLWTAEAIWVTHGGGTGELMANWICDGSPNFDVHELDGRRFEPHALAPSYIRARGAQQYREVYDIIHPAQPIEEPRPLRVSPFYDAQRVLGASFREARGWERPHWFEANSDLPLPDAMGTRDEWAGRFWSPIIAGEALRTRTNGALFDMTSLPKIEVLGTGALSFLQGISTNDLDRAPGNVTYTLLLNEHGGIVSDITVARLEQNKFQIGCNGAQDAAWLQKFAPDDVWIRDVTDTLCCIGVWGPRARDVVERASGQDWSNAAIKYFGCCQTFIGEVPVTALRVSYVGELGYEIYAPIPYGARLWQLLRDAGCEYSFIAAGRGAFDSLRLEKGYRLWGADMTSEHAPDEAGLNFAVKPDKGDFFGREALIKRRDKGFAKTLRAVTINDGSVVLGKEPVLMNGQTIGYVTSADFGYNIGRSIAYAHLPRELKTCDAVTIKYFDRALPATITDEPLYDPKNARQKG
jgi:glycine cleavage system aminomethyltransferase T/glycine/D-amino acid oxidase-like deaminating enzyme